jgi:hypothetical protein
VIHADQPGELDRHADLLKALPHSRDRGILVIVDKPTGQAPEAIAGLDRPAPQDDSALGYDDHRGRHLWVVPQDEAVIRAGLDLTTFDHTRCERAAAVDAEMPHSRANATRGLCAAAVAA